MTGSRFVGAAEEHFDSCVGFLRDLVAIPSPSRSERLVAERVALEMERLGFEEIKVDRMGNVLGRIGSGPVTVCLDAHMDTVGITNPKAWRFDPFSGQISEGVLYGRGASDQKGGLAAIVHGASVFKEVGSPGDVTLWVTATVLGEDCVGLAWKHLIEVEGFRPDAVVVAMPSYLGICRGQRGRVELEISTVGISSHGAHPERGRNAIYEMVPIVEAVERLNRRLRASHRLLGAGSVVVTSISSKSPSLTAVPDECTVHLDRRITPGETREMVLAQLREMPEVRRAAASVKLLSYSQPSWTGHVAAMEKFFPAWETPETSPAYKAALDAAREVLGREPRIHLSAFSSSGCVTAGVYGIPTIGFGPGDEIHSHTNFDQIPLAQLVPAMAFYAAFASAVGRSLS